MSLLGALSSATAGLRTVQANLKVVADNITHADDPTRTRHQLNQSVDSSGVVYITTYDRTTDKALLEQVNDLASRDSRYQTQSGYLSKIGDLLNTTSGTAQLSQLAEKFKAAWKTLEATPESEVAAYQVVSLGNDFAREINRVSTGVEDIDRQINTDIDDSVSRINDLLGQISDINNNMSSLKDQGAAGIEVQDKRDGLVRELNQLVGVRTMERPDGRMAIFTVSGLALLDAEPAKLSYQDGKIEVEVGNIVRDVSGHFATGKLGALCEMRTDNSASGMPPSTSPTGEILRKLRTQLDGLAKAFTQPTTPGEPTSFADAYNDAAPALDGELGSRFFIGGDRFTLAINPALLDHSVSIKASAVKEVVKAVNAVGRTLTADGLVVRDASYTQMVTAITGNLSTITASVKQNGDNMKSSHDLLSERYSTSTGVNLDQEIALLQQLQTSYAASARVMQVATTMFDALEAVIR
jgi:flagellar hook-associated protein 1